MYIRQDWANRIQFVEEGANLVFDRLHLAVDKVRGGGESPIVVFDLDSTLFNVAPRTEKILREWVNDSASEAFLPVRDKMREFLAAHHIGYSLQDTLMALGFDPAPWVANEAEWKAFRNFWARRFFSSEYLVYDETMEGAVDRVCDLHAAGATIYYLTGRDAPGMKDGTLLRLLRDGFPMDSARTGIFLKPDRKMQDLTFKVDSIRHFATQGKVLASFENEPANLVAMAQAIPEAMHVFVDTSASENPAKVHHGLFRIKDFRK